MPLVVACLLCVGICYCIAYCRDKVEGLPVREFSRVKDRKTGKVVVVDSNCKIINVFYEQNSCDTLQNE